MTPEQCAHAVNHPVNGFGTRWMFEPETFAAAGAAGFGIMDFYVCGRAGCVPGIDADGAHEAMAIFDADLVARSWEEGAARQPVRDTAQLWADACAAAGRRHLPDDARTARLAELAARVSEAAGGADAPIFAAWRTLPVPEDAPGRAAHHLNALRELRGGVHLAALRGADVDVVAAVGWRAGPDMARLFGHSELPEFDDAAKQRWKDAEAATNAGVAGAFTVLDEEERTEFADLVAELL